MKKAFTMIELIFVLVVIGILAATIIPRMKTNPVQEAAIDLVAQIRYTQHLAMSDDKYDKNNASWYKNRWQIVFVNNTYSIENNNESSDYAKDPLNRTKDIDTIELKGLNTLSFEGGCAGKSIISFDYLGRPLIGSLSLTNFAYTASGNDGALLNATCNIKLTNGDETAYIDISKETGYARIRYI